MFVLKGKTVFGAIARGKISFYHADDIVVNKHKVDKPELELEKYRRAKKSALEELDTLYQKALDEVGETDAQIFIIHQMLLNDNQYNKNIEEFITVQKFNADYAVARTAQVFTKMLSGNDSDYIKGRSADIKDISDRLIRHILNHRESSFSLDENSIICADDLMPSETMLLDKSKVAAFCTSYGTNNSHTAILARTMNIPALIGMGNELSEDYNGMDAIVDGYKGILYIQPDKDTIRMIDREEAEEGRSRELLRRLRGRKNITRDGHEIQVFANIGCLADAASANENDAGGIGLFRSEFMYMEKDSYPDEEVLFYNYRRVLEDMNGKEVVVRTIDVGADKQVEYFGLMKEKNPALGYRAIRVCLGRPEIFKTQLRALFRASVYGKLSIMLPLIIDAEEIRKAKKIINEVKEELIAEHKPFSDNVALGIMIETPAAVMLSDILADECDFFSIGTNDLEQYTLAIDRQNPNYETICPSSHIAVLRMIKVVCDNAHAHGLKVCICGELGADLSLTETFLDMHVDRLSVTPSEILPLRKVVRSISLSDRKRIRSNLQTMLKY